MIISGLPSYNGAGDTTAYEESNSATMSDQDAFDRILASLHTAMLDEGQWPATSALIDEACGTAGNTLMVGTGPKDDIEVTCAGFYYRGQRRADLEREYLEIYHPIDERVPRFRQLPDSQIVPIASMYTAEELKTSPVYNEALRRYRGQAGLNVRLAEPEGFHIAWGVADPVTPGGWTAPQLALLRGLLPHLRHFVQTRRALARAEAQGTSATALLDTTRVGVIQLDRRGRIMAANDRALDFLRRSDGVTDQDGMLGAPLPADQTRLAQLIAAALPAARTAVSGSMLLPRAAGLSRLVVHVKPVDVQQFDFGAQRVAVLVLLVEPDRPPRIDPGLVASTLGLTPAESHVAVQLAEGRTVRDIAATTGRQEGSIHWLLRRIYTKQGISRQVDLVRLVLSIAEFA